MPSVSASRGETVRTAVAAKEVAIWMAVSRSRAARAFMDEIAVPDWPGEK
jgi:hypothetical protein